LLIFEKKFHHLQYHKIEKKKTLMERIVLVLACIWTLAIVGFYRFHYKFYMCIGHVFDHFLKLNSNMISNMMWCLKNYIERSKLHLHWILFVAILFLFLWESLLCIIFWKSLAHSIVVLDPSCLHPIFIIMFVSLFFIKKPQIKCSHFFFFLLVSKAQHIDLTSQVVETLKSPSTWLDKLLAPPSQVQW